MPTANSESGEIIRVLSERYPKFSKIQLCMIRNPEYGVCLAPEAKKLLKEKIKTHTQKRRKDTKSQQPQPPAKKRVSMRLSETEYEKLKETVRVSGCKTIQEYMEKTLFAKE